MLILKKFFRKPRKFIIKIALSGFWIYIRHSYYLYPRVSLIHILYAPYNVVYAPSCGNMYFLAVLTVRVLYLSLAGIYSVFIPQFIKCCRIHSFFNAANHIIYQKKLRRTNLTGVFASNRRTLYGWKRFVLPDIKLLHLRICACHGKFRKNFIPCIFFRICNDIVHTVIVHSGNISTV